MLVPFACCCQASIRFNPLIREANVEALVSKWDEAELEEHAGREQVDVTLKLVGAFQPSERTRKNAMEIQKLEPVPIKKTKH